MSSIQATDSDTSRFLNMLETISAQQKTICAELDELTLLMLLPSESVLRVLQTMLTPMSQDMGRLTEELKNHIQED